MEWRVRGGDSSCCILRVKREKEDDGGWAKKRRTSTDGDGDFGDGCATESQRTNRREVRPSRSGGEGRTAHACSGSIGPAGLNNSRSLILLREHRPSPLRAPSGVEGASNGQEHPE